MSALGPDDWVDVTTIGDNYQVEMTVSGKYFRHRRMSIGGMSRPYLGSSPPIGRAWIPGRPPSGFHSRTNGKEKENANVK